MRTAKVVSNQTSSARRIAARFAGVKNVGDVVLARITHGVTREAQTVGFHECSTYATLLQSIVSNDGGAPMNASGGIEYLGFPAPHRRGLLSYEALIVAETDRLVVSPLRVLFADVDDARDPFADRGFDCGGEVFYSGGSVAIAHQLGYGGRLTKLYRDRGKLLLAADPVIEFGGRRRELKRSVVNRINAFTGNDSALALQS